MVSPEATKGVAVPPPHSFLLWTVPCKDLCLADGRRELQMEPEETYRPEFLFVEKKRGKKITPSLQLCPQLFCLMKTLSPPLCWHCWCGVLHTTNTIPKASQMRAGQCSLLTGEVLSVTRNGPFFWVPLKGPGWKEHRENTREEITDKGQSEPTLFNTLYPVPSGYTYAQQYFKRERGRMRTRDCFRNSHRETITERRSPVIAILHRVPVKLNLAFWVGKKAEKRMGGRNKGERQNVALVTLKQRIKARKRNKKLQNDSRKGLWSIGGILQAQTTITGIHSITLDY